METNLERIKEDIESLARFNSTPHYGITRFSYSENDKKARKYLIDKMEALGLKITIDGVGNIRGRMEGVEPNSRPVLMGSHIDTVLHGGKFDGIVGVIGALEVLRVLRENDIKLDNPVEIIIFSEEEGSNFESTMAGSKALVGKYGVEDLKKITNKEGLSMYEMAQNFGLKPNEMPNYVIQDNELEGMLELHIEQSSVLESENISLGVVKAIAGIKWYKVELEGIGNHAGATPMYLRKDALVGAAEIVSLINGIVNQTCFETTVGTVGRINCYPNVPNIIPEKVSFTIDLRDVNAESIEKAAKEIMEVIKNIAKEHHLEANIELLAESKAIKLSKRMINTIESVAKDNGFTYKLMNSGAGHDSCVLADITDVGMIFIPSINGRSHVPEELTRYEDIKLGCDLLLNTLLRLTSK